ncbi:MAG: hypothetical protein OEU93_06965 [Rubrivivax sp.]|nr:hypothetical protein [Rubrivivax sp.]
MMLSRLSAPLRALRRLTLPTLVLALATTLVSCGGGGYLPSPLSVTEPRPLSPEFTSRKAASYSPYRDAQCDDKNNPANVGCTVDLSDEVITPARVEEDLRLVQSAGIGVIRLFTSNIFGDLVLSTIRNNGLDLKVMLGAYVFRPDTPDIEAANQSELNTTIALANKYSDIVLAVSVGNETMVDWSFLAIKPDDMRRYIKQVRDATTQPITTDDNWYFWATAPTTILDVVDFASLHTYPLLDSFYDPTLWDWRQAGVPADQRRAAMLDAAVAEAKRQVGQARAYFDRIGLQSMPIVIGETGWMAVDLPGDPDVSFRASAIKQTMYYQRLRDWAAEPASNRPPANIFYFESFDELWKGADDGWGLFTRDRKARCVVQSLNPPSASWVYDTSQPCVPLVPGTPPPADVTRYVLFSDAAPGPGDLFATGLRWDAFDGSTAEYAFPDDPAPGDGTQSIEITPTPASYGWGLLLYPSEPSVRTNLADFAQGTLNFWIRTDNYPGKIEIGIFTSLDDGAAAPVFLQIAPGQYGYCNNNAWCQVSIPIADFLAAEPFLDLRFVTFDFVISDVYSRTGKAEGTTGLPPIYVDGIAWTR